MRTVILRISGRVQGVSYRAWTQKTATSLNLNGWVRNRKDGTVEALVAGDSNNIDTLIDKCWSGPSAADVKDITVNDTDQDAGAGFKQEATL